MAPKAKATAAKGAPKPAKPTGPAKNPQQEPPPQPQPEKKRKLEAMDRQELKALLSKLGYDEKKGGEVGESAKAAKAIYEALDDQAKRDFLAAWVADGKGKKGAGGYAWVSTFRKVCVTATETVEGENMGFIFAGEVLAKAALRFSDFKEDSEWQGLVKSMVETNAAEYGHAISILENKDPRLTRYWWCQSLGATRTRSSRASEEMARECQVQDPTMLPVQAREICDTEPNVKEELPGRKAFQSKISNLSAAVAQLQRGLAMADGTCARLQLKGRADPAIAAKHKEFEGRCNLLKEWVSEVLLQLEEWRERTGPADYEALSAQCEAKLGVAGCHLDGIRSANKRACALLG